MKRKSMWMILLFALLLFGGTALAESKLDQKDLSLYVDQAKIFASQEYKDNSNKKIRGGDVNKKEGRLNHNRSGDQQKAR